MKGSMNVTWTSSELYDLYCENRGILTQKQMLANLREKFGGDVVALDVEGCETLLGFKSVLSKTLKLIKQSEGKKDDEILKKCQN